MQKRRSCPFQSSSPGGGLSCVPVASAEIAILQGCHPCLFQGSLPDGGPSCVPVASVGIAILQGRRTRQFQGSWPGGGPSCIPVASAEIAILQGRRFRQFQGSSPGGGPSCVPSASAEIAILQKRRSRQFRGSSPGGSPAVLRCWMIVCLRNALPIIPNPWQYYKIVIFCLLASTQPIHPPCEHPRPRIEVWLVKSPQNNFLLIRFPEWSLEAFLQQRFLHAKHRMHDCRKIPFSWSEFILG